jgi:hypothetical protein
MQTTPVRLNFIGCKEREVKRREGRKAEKKNRETVATEFSQEIHRRIVERFPDVDGSNRNENTNTRLAELLDAVPVGCRVASTEETRTRCAFLKTKRLGVAGGPFLALRRDRIRHQTATPVFHW